MGVKSFFTGLPTLEASSQSIVAALLDIKKDVKCFAANELAFIGYSAQLRQYRQHQWREHHLGVRLTPEQVEAQCENGA
jgi:hypothetical protein